MRSCCVNVCSSPASQSSHRPTSSMATGIFWCLKYAHCSVTCILMTIKSCACNSCPACACTSLSWFTPQCPLVNEAEVLMSAGFHKVLKPSSNILHSNTCLCKHVTMLHFTFIHRFARLAVQLQNYTTSQANVQLGINFGKRAIRRAMVTSIQQTKIIWLSSNTDFIAKGNSYWRLDPTYYTLVNSFPACMHTTASFVI